jgi:DNA-binding GntR family transcriptional regulator
MTVAASSLQPDPEGALSLSERATVRIRELIVTLELAPGSPVSERELMQLLGLGRTPVREALRTLAQEKLVEVYPRRGIVVSPVDVGDLASLSEARLALESDAARWAAERATAEERAIARSLLAELPGGHAPDERALIELDQRIHRHVYRCAHNAFVESTLLELYTLSLRIWFLALDRVGAGLDDAVTEHRALLEAVAAGEAENAELAMRHHIEAFERAIRAVL